MSRFVHPLDSQYDLNGKPLDGAKREFFEPGDVIQKDTFSDEALTVPNTNPVIADATGTFPEIWLNGDYDATLKDKNDGLISGPLKIESFSTSATSTKLNPLTTAAMKADARFTVDDVGISVPETKAFSTGKGGGGTYDIISGTGTANGFNILAHDTESISFVLRIEEIITIRQFGASDAVADNSPAIQAAVDASEVAINNKTVEFEANPSDAFYPCLSQINVGTVSLIGTGGARPRISFNGSNGFVYALGVKHITVNNLYIAHLVRHTTTPNSFIGIQFLGDTSNRPFWNVISNNFIDGFGVVFDLNWMWATTIKGNIAANCGTAVKVTGLSVNNFVHHNQFGCVDIHISMTDSANAVEGWHIHNNLFESNDLGKILDVIGGGFCYFYENICDHQGPGTLMLLRSGGTAAIQGWDVKDNYIAVSSATDTDTAIRLLNNITPGPANKGHSITGNRIFAYPGSTLNKGILQDGTDEENNFISDNRIETSLADIDIIAGTDTTISNNKLLGPGFQTTVDVIYEGNVGTIITSVVFLQRIIGNNTEYLGSTFPVTGTYKIGDFVKNTNPAVLGSASSQYTIKGWDRITDGSGAVLNTDWTEARVLTGT